MKNKFMTGLLSGAAGTLLIVTIILSVYWMTSGGIVLNGNGAVNIQGSGNQEKGGSEEEGPSLNQIAGKISLLEEYIDKYFMEEVDKQAYADGIYKGVLSSLKDPYSVYYTKSEYQALKASSSGIYCGIGATVSQNVNSGIITIVKPFAGGPAFESGLLPGDIIYKIEGEEVTGEDLTEVVGRMKGEEDTKVRIEIVREGEPEPIEFTLTRKKIEVPTIEYEMLDNKIGYIAITEFDEVTSTQFRDALTALEGQGMNGLVVDLRNNGGGLLDAVVDMLDRMLPKGMIVSTKDKYGEGDEYKSSDKESFDKPLAVLINGNSASASEVFAGAVQDYKLGTLVGTTSFGKGIVQSVIPLKDGSAIKLTTSKYYTPNGRNIHGTGIDPDVEVELDSELKKKAVIEKDEDNQLQKAIEIVEGKMKQ